MQSMDGPFCMNRRPRRARGATRPPARASESKTEVWRRVLLVVRVAFFLSGGAALIYQIVWLRVLSTIFGNTTIAFSVCLTAFMAGLALGSYALGRWADGCPRPFRLYAMLEIGIGVYGLASLALLSAVRQAYLALAGRTALDNPWLTVFQFCTCFLVLLVPTALMGGTLPVMIKGIVRQLTSVGAEVGWLYGVNTFGAAAGVFGAGLFLVPTVGLQASVRLAALVNLAVGLAVLRLGVQSSVERADTPEAPAGRRSTEVKSRPDSPQLSAVLIVAFGLSGFAGLALEVAWGRALCLFTGSSVYAISAVLFAVLVGIGLGSLLVAWLAPRLRLSLSWFGGGLVAAGAATLTLVWLYNLLPGVFFHVVTKLRHSYPAVTGAEALVILTYLLIPTVLSGAAFPILSRFYVHDARTLSRSVGVLYAANTVGCILGAFAAGFVLIPQLGLRATVLVCAACYVVGGAAVLLNQRGPTRLAGGLALPVLAAVVVVLPNWRHELMSAGLYSGRHSAEYISVAQDAAELIFYREGTTSTVSVHDIGDIRVLRVNGKPEASNEPVDRQTQATLAHLPLLLADRIDAVLVIGLGCGATAGAAALHPAQRIDCVEIEPAVVEAAGHFEELNRDVLSDPRCNVIVADARNYVAATHERYDAITCEPSNPWMAGVSSLFTVEHFRACRDKLADDGVICQWLHLYEMGADDVLTVAASFVKVFPDATLWGASWSGGDVVLIARKRPWKVDFAKLEARMHERLSVREDLREVMLGSPMAILASLLLGPDDLRRMAAAGKPNTDDLPRLEFSAPRHMYDENAIERNVGLMRSFASQALEEIVDLGDRPWSAQDREALADGFIRRYRISAHLLPTLRWARDQYVMAMEAEPTSAPLIEKLAAVEGMMGELGSALLHFREVVRLDPDNAEARGAAAELERRLSATPPPGPTTPGK